VSYASPTASGGCPPLNVSCDSAHPSGSFFPIGMTTVSCSASDSCGNSTNCQFIVTVNAAQCQRIVLTCSSNITVTLSNCTATGANVSYASPTASGGCPPLNVSCD